MKGSSGRALVRILMKGGGINRCTFRVYSNGYVVSGVEGQLCFWLQIIYIEMPMTDIEACRMKTYATLDSKAFSHQIQASSHSVECRTPQNREPEALYYILYSAYG